LVTYFIQFLSTFIFNLPEAFVCFFYQFIPVKPA